MENRPTADMSNINRDTRLESLPQATLDTFAKNSMMVYNWAMPVEDCKMIIQKFEQVLRHDISLMDVVDTENKKLIEINIDKYGDFWKEPREKFMGMMEEYVDRFKQNLNIETSDFPLVIDRENIKIKKYLPNDKDEIFKVDSEKRFVAFILYLNDVEEGGETHLPKQEIMISPRAGRMLMFPPFWTHPHAELKPVKEPKYIMMSYLHCRDTTEKGNGKK
jgi:prolyl 4-hydroxylase